MDGLKENKWLDHHHGKFSKTIPTPLRNSWIRSRVIGVDPNILLNTTRNTEKFRQIKSLSIKPYVYSNRFIRLTEKYFLSDKVGAAFFNEDGVLLKIFGTPKFIAWAKERGIQVNTDWCEETVGANAVSAGLKEIETLTSTGTENYNCYLTDVAIYFSPVNLYEDDGSNSCLGGVALFMPEDMEHAIYLAFVRAVVLDIDVHMHMTKTLHKVFSKMDVGMLMLDVSRLTDTVSISYYNDEIFNVLEIPKEDLNFKKLETLFKFGVENALLWNIIQNDKIVREQLISLTIDGTKKDFIISTEKYDQPDLSVKGIRLYVKTPHHAASQVSKQIGGGAVMTFDSLIGDNRLFRSTIKQLKQCALSDANVLLLGESGVGKDIIAQALHNASNRKNNPFIAVNCAAFPRDLIASELFGYEGGAFTGSKRTGNIGKFEIANTGTIFLDEIGDMPLDLQALLLRVIEQKCFMKLGGQRMTTVDVKIISATNANLQEMVEKKKFRMDLYYRLSTLKVQVPPLRQRGRDIVLLAEHFIKKAESRLHHAPGEIMLSDEAKSLLISLSWPGNVRELQNVIEGVIVLNQVNVIEPEHILSYMGESYHELQLELPEVSPAPSAKPFRGKLTKTAVMEALAANGYKKGVTADYLGISRKTLYRKMIEFSIDQ